MEVEKKVDDLPSFFEPLFWGVDFSSVETEKHARRIIVKTINYGGWKHWKWIFNFYGKKRLKEMIREIPKTEFRKPALNLACVLLGIKKMKYASRSDYIRSQKSG